METLQNIPGYIYVIVGFHVFLGGLLLVLQHEDSKEKREKGKDE
jgi:hypothetical protein